MGGRWLSFLIVGITIVVLAIGGWTLVFVHQHLMDIEGETLAMTAEGLADQLHQTVVDRVGEVKVLARAAVLLQNDTQAMSTYLTQVSNIYQTFEALSFVSVKGRVIASSRTEMLGQDLSSGLDLSMFQITPKFELFDVRPNPFLGEELTLTLVSPVITASGELRGMIIGNVSLAYLRKIFDNASQAFEQQRGVKSALEWQLLNQRGMVIVDSMLNEEGEVNLRDEFLPSAWEALKDESGYVEEQHLRRQVPVITGFAKMQGIPESPGFRWGILVRRDQATVLAAIWDLETKLGLAAVGIVLPMIVFLMVLIRRLRKSELDNEQLVNRLEAMMTALHKSQAVIEFDLDGTILTANTNFLQPFGYALEEIQGKDHRMFVEPSEAASTAYIAFWEKLNRGEFDAGVYKRVGKDHREVWIQASYNPVFDASGRPYKVVKFATDITAQKQMEGALKIREAEIVDAMTLTQGIVDTAADGIITIDEQGTVESFNKAARSVFQYSESEVLGKNISMLMPSPYHEEHDQYLQRYRESGERHIIGIGREVVGRRKDGTTFPIDLSISEVQMGSRRVFTGIIRDISQRKQSEAELVEARDQAFEAVRLKSEFLAMMSHEIRTPMNGVLGMTGILLETDLDKDQRDYAETVKNSADSLLTIINDILDFSKIESGKLDIEIIDFDLRVAIEEVLDLIGPKAQEKNLELIGLIYASVPTAVRGDPGRFRQILLNLVSNAIKFTAQGEIVVQVIPQEETDREVFLRVEVKDTGIGISPEAQQRLFQPFSQADGSTTRKYGGTGLGLAICKQLAELMQGTIGVDSSPGQGSCFWFTVRMEKQAEISNSTVDSSANLNGLRVCVVDDNDTNRLLIHHFTNGWGMTCLSAESASMGLSLLKEAVERGEPCDLLLIDVQMPEMDGFTMARLVKADPVLKDTKIVMVTSLGRRGDAGMAREIGIAGYLTKPFRQTQLRDCLLLVMNGSSTEEIQIVTKYTIRETEKRNEGRLLVADDNVVNQKVAVRMLEKFGYRVDVVANGLEAVEAVSRIPYHLVFMDCQMPEMDGYEATREIRKRDAKMGERAGASKPRDTSDNRQVTTHLPIIAMTANAMPGDRDKCLEVGMDDFISKPVNKEALEAILDQWVPNKEIEGEEMLSCDQDLSPEALEMQDATDARRVASPGYPATNDEAHVPPIDSCTFEGLRELSGEDPSFLKELIRQYLHDALDHMSAIQRAVIEGNAEALMQAAHGFKGSCRNMGAISLGDLCFSLEQKGHAGEMEHVAALSQDLTKEYNRVHGALEAELEKLTPSPAS